jgi:myosin heavy subunit
MTDQQTKRVIVVLSAGRSGTSLLMKALGFMGMKLSENMIPGSAGNPEGFFEDAAIVEVHKQLIDDLGTQPTLPLPQGWLESEATKKARRKLREILESNLEDSNGIWGFKDPRTVSFLPLWNRILNAPGAVPVFVLAVRDPAVVATSLNRQINREKVITELQWLQRTTDALHHTAADCFIVHYEDWFTRPTELAQGLLAYTGLDQYFSGSVGEAIKNVVKPNLNRSVYEDYQVQNEYVLKLYDVLKDCRGDEFDRNRLMAVVKECRRAMDGFKGWYMEAQKQIGQQAMIRERLEQEQGRSQEMKERMEKKRERIIKLESKVEALQHKNNEYLKQLKEFEQELKETRNTSDKRIEQTKAEYEQALQGKTARIEELEQDLHEITLQNNEYLKQLKEFEQELKETRNTSDKRIEQTKAEYEQALQGKTARIEELEQDLHEITLQNNEYLKQLKDLHDEKENLRISLSARQNELQKIRLEHEKNLKQLKTRAARLESIESKLKKVRQAEEEAINRNKTLQKKKQAQEKKLKKEIFELRNSYSFRIGQVFVNAVAKPGVNTVMAPFRLAKLVIEPVFSRKNN